MEKSNNASIHIFIHGSVTGVGYRAWMVRHARELHLTGWVRNKTDSLVEVLCEGPKESLHAIISLIHKGPEVSWVEKADVTWSTATGEYEDFHII